MKMDYFKLISQRHFRPAVPTAKLYSTYRAETPIVGMVNYKVDNLFKESQAPFVGNLNSNNTPSYKTFSNPNFMNTNQNTVDVMPTVNTLAPYTLQTIKNNSYPIKRDLNSVQVLPDVSKTNNMDESSDKFYDCENSISVISEPDFQVDKHNYSNHNRKIMRSKLKNRMNRTDSSKCDRKPHGLAAHSKLKKSAHKQSILHDIEMDIEMDNENALEYQSEDSITDEYFTGDSECETMDTTVGLGNVSKVCTGIKHSRLSPEPECSSKKSRMCSGTKSPNTNFYRSVIEEIALEKKFEVSPKTNSGKRPKCCCSESKRNGEDKNVNDVQKNVDINYKIIENANNSIFEYDVIFSDAKKVKPERPTNSTNESVTKNTSYENVSHIPFILKESDVNLLPFITDRSRTTSDSDCEDFVHFEEEHHEIVSNISDCESDDSYVLFSENPSKSSPPKCMIDAPKRLRGLKNLILNKFNIPFPRCNRSDHESDDSSLIFDDSDSVRSSESQESSIRKFDNLNIRGRRVRVMSDCESEDSFVMFKEHDGAIDMDQLDWNDDDVPTDESDSDDCDSEGCDETDCCSVTSETWVKTAAQRTPVKKVQFKPNSQLCLIYPMIQWSHAYQKARKGEWEEAARDRERFQCKISRMRDVIDPILSADHREKIYQERFNNN